jgi:hypothetical protein
VKERLAEDIEIMRVIKRSGLLPGIAAFYHIAFLAAKAAATGRYEWKGRNLKRS